MHQEGGGIVTGHRLGERTRVGSVHPRTVSTSVAQGWSCGLAGERARQRTR
ncbi:hypothetical protein ACVILE_006883 [Streptomyces sp. M18.1]